MRKKLFKQLLALVTGMALFPVFSQPATEVYAEDNSYGMACSAYEVDVLNDDGTLSSQGCYNDLASAKSAMYSLGDGAMVRHSASRSASKIIMVSSGVAYSYPQRNGSNTATIEQYYETIQNEKTTYVTVHREMQYLGTYTYDPSSGDGWVCVQLNGFTGYIRLSNIDLVPMKAVEKNIAMYLGGNSTLYDEDPFLVRVHQAYYKVEQNGNYLDLVYHCFSGWASDLEPQEWTFDIGPAASWMSAGSVYYSYDGTTFYTDRWCSIAAGTYYDYYQFMPLRTRSDISASVYDSYLSAKGIASDSKLWGTGTYFTQYQEQYGVNALATFAMACLESAYGTSNYAQERNNLFGWSAYDSDPDQAATFSSIQTCIEEHMGINLRGYLNIQDYRFFGGHLGNKGSGFNVKYAGDPYWGMKIAAICYEIDKLSCNYNGSLTDCDSAALGVIADDASVNILKTINGDTLYNSAYGATYQKNHTVTILAESGDWYMIQSTSYLENGSVRDVSSIGLIAEAWDWDGYIGWLPKDEVVRINDTTLTTTGLTPTGDAVSTLTELSWNDDGTLHLSGQQYRPGIYVDGNNQPSQILQVLDAGFTEVLSQELTTVVTDNDVLTWSCDLDVSSLARGTYTFTVSTAYSLTQQYGISVELPVPDTLPENYDQGALTYTFQQLGEALSLQVSARSCGANASYDSSSGGCVCNSGFENWQSGKGCTVITSDDSSDTMMQGVQEITYDSDTGTYTLHGVAFFMGQDARADDTDITHQVYLVDMETGEATALETTTINESSPPSFGDGYDYTRIGYTCVIDPAAIEEGTYYFQIQLSNGEQTNTRLIISSEEENDMAPLTLENDETAILAGQQMSNLRLEIAIGRTGIDRTLINRKVRRLSIYGQTAFTINEQGLLSIDGYAYLSNTYVNAENSPAYSLIFENTADGSTTTVTAKPYACTVDFAALTGSDYSVKNACFRLEAYDLTTLAEGTYRIYIDASTTNSGTVYRDIYQIYSASDDLPEVTVNGVTYSVTRSKVHDYLLLTISEAA